MTALILIAIFFVCLWIVWTFEKMSRKDIAKRDAYDTNDENSYS